MILVSELAAYLHAAPVSLDAATQVLPGALVGLSGVAGGDRAIFITPTQGPGPTLEGAADVQNFQFRFRGVQGDPQSAYEDAEIFAKTVDLKLINATYPTTIGGRVVIRLWRTGGPPVYLASDSSRRAHFTCGYLFEAAAT